MEPLKSSSEIEWEMITTMPRSKWSEKRHWLDEVAEKMKLPEVVKICTDLRGSDYNKKIDTSVPFLAYSRRRRTKVYSELLWWDEKKKAWVVDGPAIEIPKDYTGWFEIIKSKKDKLSGFPIPYSTISQIADDGCSKFLVRSTLIGHTYEEDSNGISPNQEVQIYPGEILENKGISTRKWKVKQDSSKSISKEPESAFLKFSDHRNKNLCVSLGHPGKFSPIYDEDRETDTPRNAVYQIVDILDERMDFPVHVKLAFGCMPKLPIIPRKWQGVMSLAGCTRPDSLVLCSLVPDKIPLLEIPVDTDVQVQVAENRHKWLNDTKFKKVIEKVFTKVYPFLTSLKFLDIKYQRKDPNSTTENGSGSQHKLIGRATSPIEMTMFNIMDVYPPLEKTEDISDSWALSFKDPENVSKDDLLREVGNLNIDATVSSSSTDANNDFTLIRTHNRTLNRAKQTSFYQNFPKQSSIDAANLRAKTERQMSQREANC